MSREIVTDIHNNRYLVKPQGDNRHPNAPHIMKLCIWKLILGQTHSVDCYAKWDYEFNIWQCLPKNTATYFNGYYVKERYHIITELCGK